MGGLFLSHLSSIRQHITIHTNKAKFIETTLLPCDTRLHKQQTPNHTEMGKKKVMVGYGTTPTINLPPQNHS